MGNFIELHESHKLLLGLPYDVISISEINFDTVDDIVTMDDSESNSDTFRHPLLVCMSTIAKIGHCLKWQKKNTYDSAKAGDAYKWGVYVGDCMTDTLTVSNPGGAVLPVICGVNTGQHMFVPASDSCNEININLINLDFREYN